MVTTAQQTNDHRQIARMGIETDCTCKLCQQELKIRDYQYVECFFTHNSWRKIMAWLDWQWNPKATWEEHLKWLITSSKGKSTKVQLFKMVYAEIVYLIWSEKNLKAFENKSRHVK